MQKTANQIKSEFETLASGHYQIHSFLYAQEFEQQSYENLIYPLMLVYPLGGSLSGTTYSRNYRVIIADRVLKSEGNELEVESDTQLIALDVLAYWMKLGQNERFNITSSNTITPFWEKWGDEVTGHFVDIGIEEFYDFNSCAIPLSGSIPTPVNPCKDARISVNSVVYGNAPSDSNFNVVVKNQLGVLVGILIGNEWIVNMGAGCLDSTYTITNSLGATLYTGTIPSGGSLTQAIGNSTLNVNDSAGTLISSESILAEGTDSYNVQDSVAVIKDSIGTTLKSENILATASENITINDSLVNVRKSDNVLISAVSVKAENTENYLVGDSLIQNDATAPTYSQLVKATNGLILPTQEIQNNGVASGIIPSVGTINITTNIAPTSFNVSGRNVDIVVPSGGGSYDVNLVDRFGNNLGTKSVTANANWDLRTLTPFDWADLFLNNLTASYSATVENALIQLVNDLISANVFQNKSNIYPFLGGNATDNAQNLRYPFKNFNSGQLRFIGSPTHNSNGITITPGSLALSNVCPNFYAPFDLNLFHYSRTNNGPAGSVADWASSVFDVDRHYLAIRSDLGINTYVAIGGGFATFSVARSDGGFHMNGGSGTNVAKLVRNGTTVGNLTDLGANNNARLFTLGGTLRNDNSVANNSLRNYAAWSIGTRLTDTQITDEYNAWQTFQTSLGRQV